VVAADDIALEIGRARLVLEDTEHSKSLERGIADPHRYPKGGRLGRSGGESKTSGNDEEVGTVARMGRLFRTWIVLGALATALTVASTANAGLIGTGSASYCDPTASQPFAPADMNSYTLLPGGSFESGTVPWLLSGGAKIVAGNETSYLNNRSDSRSLYLPSGGSAVTPTTCFALGDWHVRFMLKNVGSSSGSVHVQVIVPSLVGGLLTVLDGGAVTAGSTWTPSPRVELLLSNVTSLIGTKAVAFRFTAVGRGAAYQIDDTYLDPWKCF
jgi:hypothetical protein